MAIATQETERHVFSKTPALGRDSTPVELKHSLRPLSRETRDGAGLGPE
jgi:hypothetical protein